MSTIRTTALSALTVVVLALAVYFAAGPHAVMAAQTGPTTCPRVSAISLSTQELKGMLNGRFERRSGLPY